MCAECGRRHCPSSCPNAPEPLVLKECDECGYEIYEGDNYYNIDGSIYCEACIYSFLRTAEVE